MVINFSKTQLGILEVLSTRWYEFLSVSDISEGSKLPASSIYDAITDLKNRNIIIESRGLYRIDFSNDIAWAMKKLTDANKLYNLPHYIQSKIVTIREKANLFFTDRILAILVFGSCASAEVTIDSDVDYLILLLKKREQSFLQFLTSSDRNFNFIEMEQKDFSDAYSDGDDFVQSILKNHILLQGDFYIRHFLKKDLPIVSSKVIHERELQLKKLEKKIDLLLLDDQPIALNRIKQYIKLKVRLSLMKKGIIPTSSKNLFDLMKKEYHDHYKAYMEIKRKDAKNIYINLVGVPLWEE